MSQNQEFFRNNLEADSWKEQGKCWGKARTPETDYWFPDDEDPDYKQKIITAKRICNICPVIKECLAYAILNEEHYGIWGGKTLKERNMFKKAVENGKITSIS